MKQKLTFATTLTTVLLFTIMVSVKIPYLVISAFVLLLARGIKMYIDATSESYELNESQPKENFSKLLLLRLLMQLIGILIVVICFYIFLMKKDVWLPLFK